MKTQDASYAERLLTLETVWWKRLLDVQRPYRMHLRRLRLGFVLDVGCGVGRNLVNLGADTGVGVDHNTQAVSVARTRGVEAYTVEEFLRSPRARDAAYDSLLLSHVAEHMSRAEAVALLGDYRRYIRPGGRVVVITPQEVGFRSDPTHVQFVDHAVGAAILREAGLELASQYSFPFPRAVGRAFKYNEFVTIGRTPR
jgi:SAM-dependent methyltransferase